MRRMLLEITCHECGVIVVLETTNNMTERIAVTTNIPAMVRNAGWACRPFEDGSAFRTLDLCPRCSASAGKDEK